jgi:hypothetical protein
MEKGLMRNWKKMQFLLGPAGFSKTLELFMEVWQILLVIEWLPHGLSGFCNKLSSFPYYKQGN